MTCRRVFVQPHVTSSDTIVLCGRTAHYVHTVLRLKTGDCLHVFDGHREYLVRLTASGPREVRGEIIETREVVVGQALEMTLAFSCVRPGPIEEILRHGTELGVSRFIPVLSRRTNRRPREKKQRWESIVASAAAQSGRVALPELTFPITFEEFMQIAALFGKGLLLSRSADAVPMPEILEQEPHDRLALLVGPEGGLDPVEEAMAVETGFIPVGLGPYVLRTETAALVAVGLAAMWFEWHGPRVDRSVH